MGWQNGVQEYHGATSSQGAEIAKGHKKGRENSFTHSSLHSACGEELPCARYDARC